MREKRLIQDSLEETKDRQWTGFCSGSEGEEAANTSGAAAWANKGEAWAIRSFTFPSKLLRAAS
jgi:hypothetical protein